VGSGATLVLGKREGGSLRDETCAVDQLVVAGWTGRDQAALEHHIRELEAVGVPRPKSTPIFYRVAASLLTTADEIQVSGPDTSGEVETILFRLADGLWVGLGADHTDRKAETMGISLAKQLCAKPVAHEIWRFDDVRPHWDRLILRSWAWIGGQRTLYQEGATAAIRDPEDLMRRYGALAPGAAMFCGTFAAKGGIRPAAAFEMQLEDPVLGRSIRHTYKIVPLPVEG
jgi:hypothetical protein